MTKKSRREDRHLPFRMVRMPLDLYERLKELAQRNERPVSWELRRAVEGHIKSETQGEQRQ